MKYLIVTFSNGTKYQIPASVIAEDRAQYYTDEQDGINFEEEVEHALQHQGRLAGASPGDWAGALPMCGRGSAHHEARRQDQD